MDHRVWEIPPERPIARLDEIHVWSASLDVPAHRQTQVTANLAAEERQRAARFRFQLGHTSGSRRASGVKMERSRP